MDATVLVPIYNDWESLRELVQNLNQTLVARWRLHLVVINDASTEPRPANLLDGSLPAFSSATCVHLKCNLGHQRAIAAALAWIGASENARPVVVMDGDGEDKPSDVLRMLDVFAEKGASTAVFAERTRRSESYAFRQFYRLYRWAHWAMVGLPAKIGNFSVLPPRAVQGLIVSNYLWYHYAATVVRTRTPFVTVKTARGHRYAGSSKMNFVSLIRHGMSAIAVHSEVLSVRLLIAAGISACLGICSLIAVAWVRFGTNLAIPGWATFASGLVVILLLQILSIAFTFSMQSLAIHSNPGFLPVRDCQAFLHDIEPLSIGTQPEMTGVR